MAGGFGVETVVFEALARIIARLLKTLWGKVRS